MGDAVEGFLFLAGAMLLVMAGAALIFASSSLRSLPRARRVLTLQLSAVGVFALSGALRGVLIGTGTMTSTTTLALGLVDALLTATFWLGLRDLGRLFAGGADRAARTMRLAPMILVAVLTYGAMGTALPTLLDDPMHGAARVAGAAIVLFLGLAMVQLHRILLILERPRSAVLPLASITAIALAMNARAALTGWVDVPALAGATGPRVDAAGILLGGALLLESALVFLVVIHRGDVGSVVVRRVLDAAESTRRRSFVGRFVRPRAPQALLPVVPEPAPTMATTRCKQCGRLLTGVDYHSHDLPELTGLRPRDVGRVTDAYRNLTPGRKAEVLARERPKKRRL